MGVPFAAMAVAMRVDQVGGDEEVVLAQDVGRRS